MQSASSRLKMKIKTKEEVKYTLHQDRLSDRGFLSRRWALAAAAALFVTIWISWQIAMALAALLAADYICFIVRRRRILRYWEAGTPRLTIPEDFQAINELFQQEGSPEPSMSDWNEAAGYGDVPGWREELRYRVAASYYAGGTLVDVGCGDGRLCWRYQACSPEDYIGVDVSSGLLQTVLARTGGKARVVEAVAEDVTLPDDCADFVVCSECFEHLPAPDVALREFYRILKPGGKIVIQTPSALRLRNFNLFHVLALFVGRWFPAILLRKMVHEHTFVTAFSYHWDFTRQDFGSFLRMCPDLEIQAMHGSTYRFNPRGSVLHRSLAWFFRLPVIHWIGWDLTVILVKA